MFAPNPPSRCKQAVDLTPFTPIRICAIFHLTKCILVTTGQNILCLLFLLLIRDLVSCIVCKTKMDFSHKKIPLCFCTPDRSYSKCKTWVPSIYWKKMMLMMKTSVVRWSFLFKFNFVFFLISDYKRWSLQTALVQKKVSFSTFSKKWIKFCVF